MDRIPPFGALRAFESAARHQSLARAATELNVTHGAISHHIRQLEDWLGVKLFSPQGRGKVLTREGHELAGVLTDSFSNMARACARLSANEQARPLTIAALPSVATCWLIPRLSEFTRQHPEISTRLVYAINRAPIDFSEVDIALVWGTGAFGGGHAIHFLDGASVPMCSPNYLRTIGKITVPAELLGCTLLHDNDREGWRDWFRAAGMTAIGPHPGPLFEDFNLLRAAALAGHGVALCPEALLVDDLASNRLVKLFNLQTQSDRAYYILEAEHQGRRASGRIAAFRDWLLASRSAQ